MIVLAFTWHVDLWTLRAAWLYDAPEETWEHVSGFELVLLGLVLTVHA